MNSATDDQIPADELDIASMQLGVDGLEFALQSREQELLVQAQNLQDANAALKVLLLLLIITSQLQIDQKVLKIRRVEFK